MSVFKVLVDSPDAAMGEFLKDQLPRSEYRVISTRPGPAFIGAAHCELPDIAVIDRVHERPDAALMEVAVLKEVRPDIRIIVLSERSSPKDAGIVEQGIFFYMTRPEISGLVQVIEAAAKAVANKKK